MHVVSVNVGRPREVEWRGRSVTTSIWKDPVDGPVRVATLNIDGDAQSDLKVHGGPEKAVYAYPSEHYDYWRRELGIDSLPWGAFGENLTTSGITETEIAIGDRVRIGSAELMVTQPRLPCFKLGIRFDREDMIKRFIRCGRSGFYLAVVQEGVLAAGDGLEIVSRDPHGVTVAEVARTEDDSFDQRLLKRAIAAPALPESWKRHLRSRLTSSERTVAHRRAPNREPGRVRMSTDGYAIVAKLAGELEAAWNAGDGEAFASPFTDNADFVNIRGEHFRGRAVIAHGHQAIFDGIYRGSRIHYEAAGGYAIAPAVRVGQVRGHLRVPSGPLAGELDGLATLVLVEQDGAWRIAVFHNTLVVHPPAR